MSKNDSMLLMSSLGLPVFSDLNEFSKLIGLSTRLLYCLSKKTDRYYKIKYIPKRNGGRRQISIPSYTLHIVQKWILFNILNKLTPSDQAMAFRRGKEYGAKQNANCHAETLYGLSIDLKDFFPSISARKVFTIFSDIGYNDFAATLLTNLCTLNGCLPQGSPCSPSIANLVALTLDHRLFGLCQKRGIIYTRYADDMYFSCDNKVLLQRYAPVIKRIIEDEGFCINEEKVHYSVPSNRKQITGITVARTKASKPNELKAPKAMKKRIRAEIFQCIVSGNYEMQPHIVGEISYVSFVQIENEQSFLASIKKYISKVSQEIACFPELVVLYNSHLFFKDLDQLVVLPIVVKDEADMIYFLSILENRRKYLAKHGLKDICDYSLWPSVVVSSPTPKSFDDADLPW